MENQFLIEIDKYLRSYDLMLIETGGKYDGQGIIAKCLVLSASYIEMGGCADHLYQTADTIIKKYEEMQKTHKWKYYDSMIKFLNTYIERCQMKQVKMIVTDLDMTVLHTDKSISEYTKTIFRKCSEKGIFTAIATARYFIGAEKPISILNPDFEITTDGTMIHKHGEFLHGTGFDIAATNNILQEILNVDHDLELSVATDKYVYWNSKNIAESPILHKAVYNDFSSPLTESAYKIVAMLPDKSIADDIGEKYNCKVICYRGENRYGFINKNAGKIQSIRKLAELLDIQISDIAAFGDDLNDIEMLTECGYGVAVENAVSQLKEVADFICESNDNDGVAKYIAQYILKSSDNTIQ